MQLRSLIEEGWGDKLRRSAGAALVGAGLMGSAAAASRAEAPPSPLVQTAADDIEDLERAIRNGRIPASTIAAWDATAVRNAALGDRSERIDRVGPFASSTENTAYVDALEDAADSVVGVMGRWRDDRGRIDFTGLKAAGPRGQAVLYRLTVPSDMLDSMLKGRK